jgi:hypothetical protein
MQEEAKLPATRRKRKKLASEEPPPPTGGAARARRRAGPDDSALHDSAIGPSDHHAGLARQESNKTTSRRDRRHGGGSASLSKVLADDDDEEGSWDDSVHRLFVEALFEIGLDQASPSVLMEHMNLLSGGDNINNKKHSFSGTADRRRRSEQQQPAPMIAVDEVNSERVKSHLQKFRKNKAKSLGDFFDEYDRWMELAIVEPTAAASTGKGYPGGGPRRDAASSAAGLYYGDFAEICKKMIKDDNVIVNRQNLLRGGDLAAFLSFATMRDDKLQQREKADFEKGLDHTVPAATSNTSGGAALSTTQQRHGGGAASNNGLSLFPGQHHDSQHPSLRDYSPLLSSGARIAMPRLSKEEEDSMLGKSFHQVASLFQNVSRLIMAERTTPQQASFHEESSATILSSVVTDPPRLAESISGPLPPTSRGLDNY